MENNLYVSPSPHIHGGDSISKNMYGVLIALIPAFLVSLYFFGLGALIVTVVSVLACMIFEYLIQRFLMKKEPTLCDGSAILTGVLLAFNLPSNLPVWIIIIGALAAIGIGKMSFGGLGNNIFNPALVGRVFLLISFPAQMTTWPVVDALNVFPMTYTDAQTGATVLSLMNEGVTELPSYGNMLVGAMGGSLGEDVDLTDKGVEEALKAGELLKAEGFRFGKAYTSYLKRAVRTLNCVLDRLDQEWIPVEKNWRLNEKHYGVLQGLNKSETAARFGEEQVHIWRRSYDVAPDPLAEDDPRNPRFDPRYAGIPDEELPRTESLKQTIERALPYWQCVIFPELSVHDEILVVAHGNSLRGIIKHLKGISDAAISELNLPTAVPYVFEFDDKLRLVKDYFLGDPEQIRKLMEAVANQGKK